MKVGRRRRVDRVGRHRRRIGQCRKLGGIVVVVGRQSWAAKEGGLTTNRCVGS